MKVQLFSGLKTRLQAAGLALLFGVAAVAAAPGAFAQDATAPVAEAVVVEEVPATTGSL